MAVTAASRRVGSTSFAFIEPDTSTSRTTVALSTCDVSIACGRAIATAASVSASSSSATGSHGFQARRCSTTGASTSMFVKATGWREGRRRIAIANARTAGTTSSVTRPNGEPKDTTRV